MERFSKKWHRAKHFFQGFKCVENYQAYQKAMKNKDKPDDKEIKKLLDEIYTPKH